MEIETPISVGELIDKLSILRIKKSRIKEDEKVKEVLREYEYLKKICDEKVPGYENWVKKIEKINIKLWDIEDSIRKKESISQFDSQFIELARSVYKMNDERFSIKNEINNNFGSDIKEQKSYC